MDVVTGLTASKPVAITVTVTLSPSVSSITHPSITCASTSTAFWIIDDASDIS